LSASEKVDSITAVLDTMIISSSKMVVWLVCCSFQMEIQLYQVCCTCQTANL